MSLVLIKLFEVASRALFTVLVTFSLPLEQAGQFGLTATLINLFAFALGWERHIDLQRQLVDSSDKVFDAGVLAAVKLYAANAVVMIPLFMFATMMLARVDVTFALFAVMIVVSELLANQLYNLTLVQRRYTSVLITVLAKNGILLGAIAAQLFLLGNTLDFALVMSLWFGLSTIGTVVLLVTWWLRMRPLGDSGSLPIATSIGEQRRASLTHFVIGLFGVVSLQADRFVIGVLLPLADIGIYFRHMLLVSLAYQLFNIGSHNRILSHVFATAKTKAIAALFPIVRREWLMVAGVACLGFSAALGLDYLTDGQYTDQYALKPALAAILLTGAIVRARADFYAMICNATHNEKDIFRAQATAFSIGIALMILLTYNYGMFGTATGGVSASALYLVLIWRRVTNLAKTNNSEGPT